MWRRPPGPWVGDSDERILELFGERIETTEFAGGLSHAFVPVDPDDQPFRVIFVSDGANVYRLVAGRLPEVSAEAGCA